MRTIKYLLPLLLLGLVAGCSRGPSVRPLHMAIVPFEKVSKLEAEFNPMARYLSQKLGRPVILTTPTDYLGVVTGLQTGQVDIAYLSSFPYALATSKMKLHLIALPWQFGSPTYHGIIFTLKTSNIHSIKDLKGKTFAFGDVGSTSGYLLPRGLMLQNGINPDKDLAHSYNVGAADAVVKAVAHHAADAGAGYDGVLQLTYSHDLQKVKLFRVIAKTIEVPNGVYVAPPNMKPALLKRIRYVFMHMADDPAGRAAMKAAENDKMVIANDRMFDQVRKIAKILNLDLSHLK